MDSEKNNLIKYHVFLLWDKYHKRTLPRSHYQEWFNSLAPSSQEHIRNVEEAEKVFKNELKKFKNS